MEIRQLRYFLAVAQMGNFTRAAERCHISQPSLSQQIQNLESELGEPLFLRKPGGVELTHAGRNLRDRAASVVEEADGILEEFAEKGRPLSGAVRLGVIPTVGPYFLPGLLMKFRAEHPDVGFQIREAETAELVQAVSSEDIELAIVSDVTKAAGAGRSVHLEDLYDEALYLAVPEGHALAGSKAVALADVPPEEVMHLRAGHCLRDQTVEVCPTGTDETGVECEQLATLLAFVAGGQGIAVVPHSALDEARAKKVVIVSLDPEPRRSIKVMKRRGKALSHAGKRFLEFCRGSRTSG